VAQRLLQRAQQAQAGGGGQAPAINIDEINAGQVEERANSSVDQLIDEVLAGHRATMELLAGYDDATLATTIPVTFPPGQVTFADLLVRAGVGHEGNHLSEVESALRDAG
jgi:hypothetical protein